MSAPLYIRVPHGGELPAVEGQQPFQAVVIAETPCSPGWQALVSQWLVRSGCLYMMAWGPECSSWDDSVDVANLEEFGYGEIPDDRFVMTTWHESEPVQEVFWFSKHSAHHPAMPLRSTVLLHISEQDKEREFLSLYAEA